MYQNLPEASQRRATPAQGRFSIFVAMLALFIPFSYFAFGDQNFRIISAVVPLTFIWAMIFSRSFQWTFDATIYVISLIYMAIISFFGGSWDIFAASFIFFCFTYWPVVLSKRERSDLYTLSAAKFYVYVATGFAVGVIVQYLLFTQLGVRFGKIDEMYHRTGFGFLWADYSFASIYLASGFIIAVYLPFKMLLKYAVLGLIFVGMVATTARSGFAALGIFYVCTTLFSFGKRRGSALKKIIYGLLIFLGCALLLYLFQGIANRQYNFQSSGRVIGYQEAWYFIRDHWMFGAYLNTDSYVYLIDYAIPHNAEMYVLAVGGIVLFLVWLLWIATFLMRTKATYAPINSAIYVSIIGLQFVPSFYSAYFLGLLMSFSFLSQESKKGPPVARRG